jgi:acetylornithine deacetylase/succinyl-diaminopimelate desuccinylase-like protein
VTNTSASIATDRVLDEFAKFDDDVVSLTNSLISAPSPNPPGDETAPAAVVQKALTDLGLPEATVIAREAHRPNLIVRIDGGLPGPHLALCGHLDTKPVGEAADEWRTDPLVPTIDGDRLYGLGSTDMKGAVAAMVMAAKVIQQHQDQLRGSLSIVLTADEEYGSTMGAHHLVNTGALDDINAMILGEPSGVTAEWDGIRIVSRGVSCFKVKFSGTQTHSSTSDWLPSVNAVEAMARFMVAFRKHFKPSYPPHPLCPTGPTINIGVKAAGGVGFGVVPGAAEFWTDVRLTPGMTASQFEQDLRDAFERSEDELNGATYTVEDRTGEPGKLFSWAPATEVESNHPAVMASQRATERVLGVSPPLAAFPGGTDAIAFQVAKGIPTLAALGPGQLPLAHGPNEWVSITSLKQAMRIYALTAFEYSQLAGNSSR